MGVEGLKTTGRTLGDIRKQEQREKIEAILADRWSLDQEDGWDEFGKETLDEIMEVFYGHAG